MQIPDYPSQPLQDRIADDFGSIERGQPWYFAGLVVAAQNTTAGAGSAGPLAVAGFLPSFPAYPRGLPFLAQANASWSVANLLTLAFATYTPLPNGSAITVAGLAGVATSGGPLPALVAAYSNWSSGADIAASGGCWLASSANGSCGVSWQGEGSMVTAIAAGGGLAADLLVVVSFMLTNPR